MHFSRNYFFLILHQINRLIRKEPVQVRIIRCKLCLSDSWSMCQKCITIFIAMAQLSIQR
jgi:hypothetical protein